MKRLISTIALSAMLVGATIARATTIGFDTLTAGAAVDTYYAGGTDSLGEADPTQNFGVTFLGSDWIAQNGFGETSPPNFAYSASGAGSFDFTGGIADLSFTYGAFSDTLFNVYAGLDGTGALLASVALPADDTSAFSPAVIAFTGKAHSAAISGGAGQFGIDHIVFSGTSVPEPATWAMMLIGLGLVGQALRGGAGSVKRVR